MSNVVINPYSFGGASFPNTYSLDFDGVDDYVDCGVSTWLDNSDTITISAWVKPAGTGTMDIVRRMDGASADFYLWISPSLNRIDWFVGNNGARTTSVTLNVGQWYHLFACYDKNLNDGTDFNLYLDGVSVATADGSNTTEVGVESMTIGENYYSSYGNIDEVAVWKTDQRSEVANVYNSGTPTDLKELTTPPDVWYRMGDGASFPNIPDEVGANPGVMTNMIAGDIVPVVP